MQKKIIALLIIALFLFTAVISANAEDIQSKEKKPTLTVGRKRFIVTVYNEEGELVKGARVKAEYASGQLGPSRTNKFGQVNWINHGFPSDYVVCFSASHRKFGRDTENHNEDVTGTIYIDLTLQKGASKSKYIFFNLPGAFKFIPIFSKFINL